MPEIAIPTDHLEAAVKKAMSNWRGHFEGGLATRKADRLKTFDSIAYNVTSEVINAHERWYMATQMHYQRRPTWEPDLLA